MCCGVGKGMVRDSPVSWCRWMKFLKFPASELLFHVQEFKMAGYGFFGLHHYGRFKSIKSFPMNRHNVVAYHMVEGEYHDETYILIKQGDMCFSIPALALHYNDKEYLWRWYDKHDRAGIPNNVDIEAFLMSVSL